jgi:hypothetical protein
VLANNVVRLSGMVTDPNPASVQINFTGVLSGSATADANGNFSLQTTGTALGTVTATATDVQNQTSAPFQTQLSTPAPTLSVTITYGANKLVTLTGSVTDIDAAGRLVSFTGVVTSSATTTGNGSFTLTTNATGLGNITASVTDLWSQTATMQVAVAPAAPTISNFSAAGGAANCWTFFGSVSGPGLTGLEVQLGGLPSLNGETAVVKSDGTFSITIQLLAQGDSGTAWAQITDSWGQTSNLARYFVR